MDFFLAYYVMPLLIVTVYAKVDLYANYRRVKSQRSDPMMWFVFAITPVINFGLAILLTLVIAFAILHFLITWIPKNEN